MSNDEQTCEACKDLASLGLGKCFVHLGDAVPPFEITEEMAENDKYGEAVVLSDRADKDVAIAMQRAPDFHSDFTPVQPEVHYPMPAYPEAKRPVA